MMDIVEGLEKEKKARRLGLVETVGSQASWRSNCFSPGDIYLFRNG